MTGLRIEKVLADFGYYPANTPLETTARIFLGMEQNVHGLMWTSNTAIGHDCTVELKIYGEKGSIEWSHEDMTHLKVSYLGEPVRIMSANRDYLGKESKNASQIPAGHPEAFTKHLVISTMSFADIFWTRKMAWYLLRTSISIQKHRTEQMLFDL